MLISVDGAYLLAFLVATRAEPGGLLVSERERMTNDSEFIDVFEASALLGVHDQTLRKLARQKKLPAFKVGKEWRFRRGALVRWADEQARIGTGRGDYRVLVVDDDGEFCWALGRMLAGFGCQTRTATSGADGLELVAQETPDLILLDLQMPDMDGPQFLEKLRATHPDVPVVIVTGHPNGELMRRASRHAPLMLLSKPVEQEPLERTVRTAIGEKMAILSERRNR